MTLKEKIDTAIKEAMRAKNQTALLALRAIKSGILLAETSEGHVQGTPLSAEQELQVLLKQSKQRKDSIEQFRKNGREELAVKEEEELAVISQFLPQALSPEEIHAELKSIIEEVGANSMKDLGKVMGIASKKLAGKADGKLIAEKVKELLQ
jgi:uncharacterized protein YqeY